MGGRHEAGQIEQQASSRRPDQWIAQDFPPDARLTVTGAVTVVGAPIYINLADNTLNVSDNTGARPLYGHALGLKATGAGEIIVRIAN